MNENEKKLDSETNEPIPPSSGDQNYDANKSELVLGLVAPVGTDLTTFEDLIEAELAKYLYEVNIVKLSKFLESPDWVRVSGQQIDRSSQFLRYETLMTAGNNIRDKKGQSFLAQLGIYAIASDRELDEQGNAMPLKRKVHILHSLKHRKEIEILREVYGEGFFLIGLYSSRNDRIAFLKRKEISETDATSLILRDYDDNERFGQQTSKVFELSDVFINLRSDHQDQAREEIKRFLGLLFGYPFTTPSPDEHAMFLAYAASLRSGSLARQIGAVVATKSGDIVSTGTNDVPRFGGGQYWDGSDDARDFQRRFDANTSIRNGILTELLDRVADADSLLPADQKEQIKSASPEEKLALGKKIFKGTALFGLTEYMRDVHAEMEALLCCVRVGISVKGGTLYCTTFPCHNCAKHIVDAGIERVVYVEAYPKSKAVDLHSDSISIDGNVDKKVSFEPFIGIGPRRYFDLFSMSLGTGREKIRKDDDGNTTKWAESSSIPRLQMKHIAYLDREVRVTEEVQKLLKEP